VKIVQKTHFLEKVVATSRHASSQEKLVDRYSDELNPSSCSSLRDFEANSPAIVDLPLLPKKFSVRIDCTDEERKRVALNFKFTKINNAKK